MPARLADAEANERYMAATCGRARALWPTIQRAYETAKNFPPRLAKCRMQIHSTANCSSKLDDMDCLQQKYN